MPPPILFVTLDSCRYDAFVEARTPNLSSIGPLVRAQSPSHFTYASHAAYFMGFTPGNPMLREPYANPKFGKIFLMKGGERGLAAPYVTLLGHNIIDGLKNLGYRTIGSGAVNWFNPDKPTGRVLSQDFDVFGYSPGPNVKKQIEWIEGMLAKVKPHAPPFVFLNAAETHVPYYYDGAPWDPSYNPCVPFGNDNNADEARRRQVACIEYCDTALVPLLERFADGTVIVCADHGDCWGEDGLWAHGVSHAKTLEVPLLFRLAANGQ